MNAHQNQAPLRKVGKSNASSVQSLLRALDLLELLAAQNSGLRLGEVAALAKLPVSSAHRFLTTLETRRFVFQDTESKRWHVGSQSLAVGASFGRRRNIGALALPIMQRLCEKSAQTINLGVVESDFLFLLRQSQGREPPEGLARPGARSAIIHTALGQSAMAAMPERAIASILCGYRKPSGASRKYDQQALSAAIRETRVRRFAIDDEVNSVGLRCVAAPIFDEFSTPIGALSIAGDSRRMERSRLGDTGLDVLQAANEVTRAIGGHIPAAYL